MHFYTFVIFSPVYELTSQQEPGSSSIFQSLKNALCHLKPVPEVEYDIHKPVLTF